MVYKGGEKMQTEAEKKACRKYRESKCQLSITISKELMKVIDEAAARTGKSKAQYIVDLVKKDNQI